MNMLPGLIGVVVNEDLGSQHELITNNDLPRWHQQVGTEAAILQLAQVVTVGNSDTRAHHLAQEENKNHDKLPLQRWLTTITILMKALNEANEGDLPAIWHAFVAAGKKQDMRVIQKQADELAASDNAFVHHAVIITPQLCQDIVSFCFKGSASGMIKCGLQPFTIVSGTDSQWEVVVVNARASGLLNEGTTMISLADLEALTTKAAIQVLMTFFELENCLGIFGSLLLMFLGENHVMCTSYCTF